MSAEIDLNVSLKNQVGVVEINRPPNNHFDYKLISYIAYDWDFLKSFKDFWQGALAPPRPSSNVI